MVQQCDDCRLWFRTEDKFRNHKSGILGLKCSAKISSPKTTKSNPVGTQKDAKEVNQMSRREDSINAIAVEEISDSEAEDDDTYDPDNVDEIISDTDDDEEEEDVVEANTKESLSSSEVISDDEESQDSRKIGTNNQTPDTSETISDDEEGEEETSKSNIIDRCSPKPENSEEQSSERTSHSNSLEKPTQALKLPASLSLQKPAPSEASVAQIRESDKELPSTGSLLSKTPILTTKAAESVRILSPKTSISLQKLTTSPNSRPREESQNSEAFPNHNTKSLNPSAKEEKESASQSRNVPADTLLNSKLSEEGENSVLNEETVAQNKENPKASEQEQSSSPILEIISKVVASIPCSQVQEEEDSLILTVAEKKETPTKNHEATEEPKQMSIPILIPKVITEPLETIVDLPNTNSRQTTAQSQSSSILEAMESFLEGSEGEKVVEGDTVISPELQPETTIIRNHSPTSTSDSSEEIRKTMLSTLTSAPSASEEVQQNVVSSSSEGNKVDIDDSIMLSDDEESEDEDYLPLAKNTKVGQTNSLCSDEDFTLVCFHLDTFKASNETTFTISQIGCSTGFTGLGEKEDTFFAPIKPDKLENYLENYKMEGDLLKALHVTESENKKFEFRAQFEIKRKEKNKIYCSTESEALENIKAFIKKQKNVILFAIDKDTIEHFAAKVDIWNLPIKGFLTWTKVLKLTTNFLGEKIYSSDLDLEDFYSEHCGKVAGYINALDVSNFLRKSIKKLFNDYAKKKMQSPKDSKLSWNEVFKDAVENLSDIKEIKGTSLDAKESNLSVEVYSSFRPCVSTKIGLEKMDTLDLSSGGEESDSDVDLVEEKIASKPKPKQSKDLLKQKLIQQFDKLRHNVNNLNQSQKRKTPPVPLRSQGRLFKNPHYPNSQNTKSAYNLRSKRSRISYQQPAAPAAIMISSDEEDDDTDDDTVDHVQVVNELKRKNPKLNVLPVPMPGRNVVPVPIPPFQPNNTWNAPIHDTRNTGKYQILNCAFCNVEFGNLEGLKTHINMIHLRCNICNIQFNILELAMAHKKIHENTSVIENSENLLSESYDQDNGLNVWL